MWQRPEVQAVLRSGYGRVVMVGTAQGPRGGRTIVLRNWSRDRVQASVRVTRESDIRYSDEPPPLGYHAIVGSRK